MLNIVLFGPPGAGKGTQSQKLVDKYHLVHLSTGDLLRSEISKGTSLGIQAKAIMDRGDLVSDDIVIGMIGSKLDAHENAKGFIFDGFPRTTAQAEALDQLLQSRGKSITMMLALEVDNAELTRRLLSRGVETGRADDQNEDIIRNRVNEYNNKTAPLKQYYSHQGKFHSVYGIGDVDQIFELLCATIENKTREKNHVHNDGTVTVADISFDDEPKHKEEELDEPEVEMEIVEMPVNEQSSGSISKPVTTAPEKVESTRHNKPEKEVEKSAPEKVVEKTVKKVAKKAAPKKAVKKAAKKAAPKKKAAKKATKKAAPKKAVKKAAKKVVKKATKKVAPKKAAKKIAKKAAPKKAAKKVVKKAAKKAVKKAAKKAVAKKVAKKAAKKVVKKAAPKKAAKKAVKKIVKKAAKKSAAKKKKR